MANATMPDAAGWDASVDAYARYAERDTGAFAPAMITVGAIEPGEEALDSAAGTGALTLPLARAGARVTAIDWSPGMATYLAERLKRDRPEEDHEVHAMDGEALTFPDARFDVALSLFGVMLFPDFRAGLAEMARVTRPGGRCVIGCWADLTAPMRLFHDAVLMAAPSMPPPFAIPGIAAMGHADGMRAELERMGLIAGAIETVTLPWSAERREVARTADRMLTQMPPWPQLSPDQRCAVLAAMADIADRDADKPFESTALIGVGHKPG